jgi:hypothetical protein
MGNFLFQVATAMAYAWKHNLEFTVPNTTQDPHSNPIYLQHLVNPRWDSRLAPVKVTEYGHNYQVIPFQEAWRSRNIILDGYWQSERYFAEYRDRLLEAFKYPWESWKGVVSFHVRRGDYLRLQRKHPPVTVNWMEKAMSKFPGYHFLFFSDDLVWCNQAFGGRKDVTISTRRSEEQDLIRMSWCEHHICSASTFAWWGAWLNRNPNKRIIIPNWWFTPGYCGLNTSDIVPPSWERMGN